MAPLYHSPWLARLAQGEATVSELGKPFGLAQPTISKHIKVLEAAGLVSRRTAGRVHWISAELGPVHRIDEWFSQLRSIWELRLIKLDETLMEDESDD